MIPPPFSLRLFRGRPVHPPARPAEGTRSSLPVKVPASGLLALAAGLLALADGGGCQHTPMPRSPVVAYPVSPGGVFQMALGQAVPVDQIGPALAGAGLVFVGEHHLDPRSHALENTILETLLTKTGNRNQEVIVGLEMFPPQADPVLEAWRLGKLTPEEFVEQSGWYDHWGYPWILYSGLFETIRRHRVKTRGLNVTRGDRDLAAGRTPPLKEEKGEQWLSFSLEREIGPLDLEITPHRWFFADALGQTGHGGGGRGSPPPKGAESGGQKERFPPPLEGYYRVQVLWDQAMGVRAARLAVNPRSQPKPQPRPDPVVVVFIGSGHLMYGVGANLRAQRELARLAGASGGGKKGDRIPPRVTTLLDIPQDELERDGLGRSLVPVGLGDLVRPLPPQPPPRIPTLAAFKLKADPKGVRVESAGMTAPPMKPAHEKSKREAAAHPTDLPVQQLLAEDVVTALNGMAVTTPAALRLAWERLNPDSRPALIVLRQDKPVTLRLKAIP